MQIINVFCSDCLCAEFVVTAATSIIVMTHICGEVIGEPNMIIISSHPSNFEFWQFITILQWIRYTAAIRFQKFGGLVSLAD